MLCREYIPVSNALSIMLNSLMSPVFVLLNHICTLFAIIVVRKCEMNLKYMLPTLPQISNCFIGDLKWCLFGLKSVLCQAF